MTQDFASAIKNLVKEKNIPEDKIHEAIKAALITAFRKDYGNKNQEIDISIKDSIESVSIFLIKEVVDEVEDEDLEITVEEAKKIKPDTEIGDEIRLDVTPVGYGRIATQAAKQVILQRIQEAEKDSLYQMFKGRENSLLVAVVNRIEGSNVYLEIDKNTILLPYKQQIPGEKYFTGKRLTVYLDRVQQTSRGPQLNISRTHPNVLKCLLEREIPEVSSGEVEVKKIARDSGARSKVAVISTDESIDPIGACVGQKGSRINLITDELSGERIDMIEYNENPKVFISRSLQPAKISDVIIVNNEESFNEKTGRKIKKRAAVFVEESERAMAIGKQGQNIRLATELTEYELDIYNVEEYDMFLEKLSDLNK